MNCTTCGKEYEEGLTSCPACATSQPEADADKSLSVETEVKEVVETAEEQIDVEAIGTEVMGEAEVSDTPEQACAEATESNPPEEKRPSSRNKILAAGLAVVMVAGAAASYAWFDFMKSPKQVLLEAEGKSMLAMYQAYEKGHADFEKLYVEKYLKNPVQTTSKISNLTLDMPGMPLTPTLRDGIESGVLEIDSTTDAAKNTGNLSLSLSGKNFEKIAMTMFYDAQTLGIKSDLVGKRAIALDLADTAGLENLFGEQANQFPKANASALEFYNAVDLKPEELKTVMLGYGKLVGDNIQDTQVTLDASGKMDMMGQMKPVRKLTVTYDKKAYSALVSSIATKAKADAQLKDLFFTRIDKVGAILEKTSRVPVERLSRADFDREYDKFWTEMDDSVKQSELSSIENSIYIAQDDTILKREIAMTASDGKALWVQEDWVAGDQHHQGAELKVKEETYISYNNTFTKKGDAVEGKAKFFAGEPGGAQIAEFATTYKMTKKGEALASNVDFDAKMPVEGSFVNLRGSIAGDTAQNDSGQKDQYRVGMNISGGAEGAALDMKFDMSQKTVFVKSFDPYKNIDKSSILNLTKATQDELVAFANEVQTNLYGYISRNQKMLSSNQ